MTEPYQSRIEAYCLEAGISIPSGFYRHSASRFAAIDMESAPPKLVAKTWFKREDAAYYLTNLAAGRRMRVLDFKERRELVINDSGSFATGSEF